MCRSVLGGLAGLLVLAATPQVSAETLTATVVTYSHDVVSDSGSSSCRLTMRFSAYPRPEAGQLEIIASDGNGWGFSLSVVDLKFQDKKISGSAPARLDSAALSTSMFDTTGRFHGAISEAGLYLAFASEPDDVKGLVGAVIDGDFTVSFRRAGSRTIRS